MNGYCYSYFAQDRWNLNLKLGMRGGSDEIWIMSLISAGPFTYFGHSIRILEWKLWGLRLEWRKVLSQQQMDIGVSSCLFFFSWCFYNYKVWKPRSQAIIQNQKSDTFFEKRSGHRLKSDRSWSFSETWDGWFIAWGWETHNLVDIPELGYESQGNRCGCLNLACTVEKLLLFCLLPPASSWMGFSENWFDSLVTSPIGFPGCLGRSSNGDSDNIPKL